MSAQLVLNVGIGAIFAAIALAVITLASASIGRAGVAKALETIDTVYAPGSAAAAEEKLGDRFRPAAQQMSALGKLLTPKGAGARLQHWLDYAGNPVAWPPERIVEMQGLGLLVFAFLGGLAAFALSFGTLSVVCWVLAGAAFGFWLPFLVVYDLGIRRQQEIRRRLPDGLDLLTLSVEAGLGFDAALAQVAASMPGALSREFARVLQEMQMGQRRADALRALAARTSVRELKTITMALVQAGELGIPIAGVLREQARQMRVKRRQLAEEKARKLPVKVLFPLIFCLFPALFVVILGPGVIGIMDAF
ncbi:type II secretion system F family protein [Catellatospora sichuanensis]|uniref:type II secretion system F family protein n=1 Tax=Catellatospora sichuanensis TaxID=1969805 RepID=UPI0011824DBA|nr:type II secretion system F family protein [Catellatospora sichuanensis]